MPYGTDSIRIEFTVKQEAVDALFKIFSTDAINFSQEIKRRGYVLPLETADELRKWSVKSIEIHKPFGAWRIESATFNDGSKWIRNRKLKEMKEKRDGV